MAANPKNPSTLIFWNDLENDERLKTCSLAAKGLWTVHMLSIAARSPEPGYVLIGDHFCRIDGDLPKLLARVAGESADTIAELLAELVASGTASVDEKGRVYNRRMVRSHGISQVRSAAGKRGAEAANAERQKSSKGVGKRGGKTGGNDPGNSGGKQSGKNTGHEIGLNHGNDGTIPDSRDDDARQTSGKPNGKEAGKSGGSPPGKSPPSSILHASDSGVVTTTESVAGAKSDDDFEPLGNDAPASEPTASRDYPSGRQKRIPPGWLPSDDARQQLARSRPDITPELLERRMVEFHAWCLAENKHTHNPDATWLGFMVKTHAQRSRDDKSERSNAAALAGFFEAGSR